MPAHPFDLAGRSAVVIGGTSGLGRAAALALARAGANVAVTGRRAELVDAAATEVEAMGRRSLRLSADATDRAALQRFRDACVSRLGDIDIVVNAAGVTQLSNKQGAHAMAVRWLAWTAVGTALAAAWTAPGLARSGDEVVQLYIRRGADGGRALDVLKDPAVTRMNQLFGLQDVSPRGAGVPATRPPVWWGGGAGPRNTALARRSFSNHARGSEAEPCQP